jgi:hypothetical protein
LHTNPKNFSTTETFRKSVKHLIWLMVVAGKVGSSFAAESRHSAIKVIPSPQQAELKGAGFKPTAIAAIGVTDDAADRFAAHLLQETLRETHGIDASILSQPRTMNPHSLWLGVENSPPPSPALQP